MSSSTICFHEHAGEDGAMPNFDEYAFKSYVERVRVADDAYAAYRVLERFWKVPAEDEALVRKAFLVLIDADPCFALSRILNGVEMLELEDVQRLLTTLTLADASTTAFARARIGHQFGAQRPDPLPDLLRDVEQHLNAVDESLRDKEWHTMLSDCLGVNDYERYVAHLDTLFASVDVQWHAHHLSRALRAVCARKDWPRYRGLRARWDALPKSAHFCECQINHLYNMDGLEALASEQLDGIAELLHKALDVRGCPHLNSGGPDLSLAAALIGRALFLDACRTHLVEARRFSHNTDIDELEAALEKASAATA